MVDFEGLMHELETHSHSDWLCYALGRILRQNTRGRFTIRAPHRRGYRERDHDYVARLLKRHGVVSEFTGEKHIFSITSLQRHRGLRVLVALLGKKDAPHPCAEYPPAVKDWRCDEYGWS